MKRTSGSEFKSRIFDSSTLASLAERNPSLSLSRIDKRARKAVLNAALVAKRFFPTEKSMQSGRDVFMQTMTQEELESFKRMEEEVLALTTKDPQERARQVTNIYARHWMGSLKKKCDADGCGNETNLMRCGRCKQVLYCSQGCQKKDWEQHKVVCISLQNT